MADNGTAHTGAPKGHEGKPCMLCEYAHHEATLEDGPRIVEKNAHWIAVVPWWAVWPFEVLSECNVDALLKQLSVIWIFSAPVQETYS